MKRILAMFVFVLLFAALVSAQERGQYVPGFGGLNAGVQAPPGWTYANYFIWYPMDRLNGPNGNRVPLNINFDLIVDFNILAHTTKAKFLGASYGFTVGVPITNTAVSLPRLGSGIETAGLADIYVEPINLGWTRPGWSVKTAYGFIAPTGKFDKNGTDTTTTDYWEHEITLAAAHNFGKMNLWQFSVNTNWEFHHTKRHEDVKAGNNMTLEYGLAKTYIRNQGRRLLQVGAVGYGEFQLTNDSGSDVIPFNHGNKDHVFGLGGEFGVIWPANKLNFLVRIIPEFGARSRTQGFTFVTAVGKDF
jgi:hypothetical protein